MLPTNTEVQNERQLCKELTQYRRLQLPHEKLSSRDVIGRCAIARLNFAGPQLRRSFSLDPVVWPVAYAEGGLGGSPPRKVLDFQA